MLTEETSHWTLIVSAVALFAVGGCKTDGVATPEDASDTDDSGGVIQTEDSNGGGSGGGDADGGPTGSDADGGDTEDGGDDGGEDGGDVTDGTDDTGEVSDGGETGETPDGDAGPTSGPWKYVESYEHRNCAIAKNGKACCWDQHTGDNNGDTSDPEGEFSEVHLSHYNNCALKNSSGPGEPFCWGGRTEITGMDEWPQKEFVDLALGAQVGCGVLPNGDLDCWGDGYDKTRKPNKQFQSLAAGNVIFCGVLYTTGKVHCWENQDGWGMSDWNDSSDSSSEPVPDKKFEELDFGSTHVCGINAGGGVDCWGDPADESALKDKSGGAAGYVDVAAGANWTCAVRATGAIDCWGDDEDGIVSKAPDGPTKFTDVSGSDSPGAEHACAVAKDGRMKCWGSGDPGVVPTTADCSNGAAEWP